MKNILKSGLIIAIGVNSLYGLTLKQSVDEVLKTNPAIQERIENFGIEKKELQSVNSSNYPTIDLKASTGYNKAGDLNNDVTKKGSYSEYDTALVLTQNIFNGFKTSSKIDYQNSRIITAGYNYIKQANDTTFEVVERYLNVLRTQEIEKNLEQSVLVKKDIAKKVKGLFDVGLKVKSDVNKINSTYALSKSNLSVRKQNLINAKIRFQRTYGKEVSIASFTKPVDNLSMPKTLDKALEYAYLHNPSLLISKYNIQGAKALHQEFKAENYPKLDLEVSQYYNDQDTVNTGFSSPDDRFRVMLKLNYNLYNGGSSTAQIEKNSLKIKQEKQNANNTKREVEESVKLSWLSYISIQEQIKNLKIYLKDAKIALNLYKQEYELSTRSLLDLLSVQNDVTSAKTQLINAQYDKLIAKYKLLNVMGKIVPAIQGNDSSYGKKVELKIKGIK